MSKEMLPKVLEGEVVENFNFVNDFDALSTPELKTHIRQIADFRVYLAKFSVEVREYHIKAITILCTRHDAGDLIAFFTEINFNPPEEIKKEIMRRNAQLGVPHAVTAAATGKTEKAVERAIHRAKKSDLPNHPPRGGQTDTSDHTPPKPVKSDNGKKLSKRDYEKQLKRQRDIIEDWVFKIETLANASLIGTRNFSFHEGITAKERMEWHDRLFAARTFISQAINKLKENSENAEV